MFFEETNEMIFALHTLKKQYWNKEIYIWNVNRDSMGVFARVLFRQIDVKGFVTFQNEYVNEMYMNRPVLSLAQIDYENSIILVADEVSENVMNMLPKGKAVYWSDCLEIDKKLYDNKIIVYGMGKGAEQLCKELEINEMEAELFCVTKLNHSTMYKGKNVIEVSELNKYSDYTVIVSVLRQNYIAEILDELIDFPGRVYIELEILLDKAEIMLNFIQNLDLAIKKHREIYIYGKKNRLSELMIKALDVYNIKVNGYVYDDENAKDIENIYDISYESGTEDKLIIINEDVPERLSKARENIEFAGFSLEDGNYTSIQWYAYADQWMLSDLQEYPDPLCGDSILYPQGKPGWKVYGRETQGRIRILVVGGSTTSEVYHPENWVSRLYYKLRQMDIMTTIYNGAHTCNDIVSEILRFLRDGYILRPHIVISMSGVNNTYYKKCQNQFNEERLIWKMKNSDYCSGVKSEESLYSFWNRNVKMLKLISEFYGATFFGFLQPMNITISQKSLREKSLFEREVRITGTKDFSQFANDEDDYVNLMRLFEHQDEMYFDTAHYTNKAHEIIANRVLETILPTIQTIKD